LAPLCPHTPCPQPPTTQASTMRSRVAVISAEAVPEAVDEPLWALYLCFLSTQGSMLIESEPQNALTRGVSKKLSWLCPPDFRFRRRIQHNSQLGGHVVMRLHACSTSAGL
jgi:hypothetical protein